MNGTLYYNKSPKYYAYKTLLNSNPITLHLKQNTSITKPVIYISRDINMKNYNYIDIPELHRSYFIEEVTSSQQYYEVRCKSDPLSSFISQIRKKYALIDRSQNHFSYYIEDERAKAYQYTHIDTITFKDSGFDLEAQEFILTVVGNPDVNANIGTTDNPTYIDGGEGKTHSTMSEEDYEEDYDTPEEKEESGVIVIPPIGSPTAASYNDETIYSYLKQSQYDALTSAEKNNGNWYYISSKGKNISGTRNIETTQSKYEALSNKAKKNNIPYFIKKTGCGEIRLNDEVFASPVEANPEQASNILETIKINGVIYSIGG